jgi:N-formylglutamate deformylase
MEKTLRSLGYTVSRNKPYAGGFITEHYGDPATGLHALQIEVNRALYMDETRYAKTAGFEKMQHDLGRMVEAVASFTMAGLEPLPNAAE